MITSAVITRELLVVFLSNITFICFYEHLKMSSKVPRAVGSNTCKIFVFIGGVSALCRRKAVSGYSLGCRIAA